MRIAVLLLALVLCVNARAELAPHPQSHLASVVFKVRAVSASGTVSLGSAVLIATGKLVTNCHVIRDAIAIEVANGSSKWPAEEQARDAYHDLCTLAASGAAAQTTQIAPHRRLHVGEAVFAVGYPHGAQLTITRGEIHALHDFDGAQVIQTSAQFTHGASGGALFDGEGRLIGILTFKARVGGVFHFALPAAWLAAGLDGTAACCVRKDEPAFWQRTSGKQPYFLRATSLEIDREWEALSALAQDWLTVEPANPAPLKAIKKARRELAAEREAAVVSFLP